MFKSAFFVALLLRKKCLKRTFSIPFSQFPKTDSCKWKNQIIVKLTRIFDIKFTLLKAFGTVKTLGNVLKTAANRHKTPTNRQSSFFPALESRFRLNFRTLKKLFQKVKILHSSQHYGEQPLHNNIFKCEWSPMQSICISENVY